MTSAAAFWKKKFLDVTRYWYDKESPNMERQEFIFSVERREPKEADKDSMEDWRDLNASDFDTAAAFYHHSLLVCAKQNDFRGEEIERLKAALDACFGVMMQFTSIGKGKFYTPHKLEIILAERKRAETLYYEAQKPLTDKDIQSKWISVEAVKELLAKQRVLCAEYLEDSFSEHPYKLHQMINYAPEPPLPNSDQNVQVSDTTESQSMDNSLDNKS
jgi:hypothetical protein